MRVLFFQFPLPNYTLYSYNDSYLRLFNSLTYHSQMLGKTCLSYMLFNDIIDSFLSSLSPISSKVLQ